MQKLWEHSSATNDFSSEPKCENNLATKAQKEYRVQYCMIRRKSAEIYLYSIYRTIPQTHVLKGQDRFSMSHFRDFVRSTEIGSFIKEIS